jgi:ArsR family transcriptional regulator
MNDLLFQCKALADRSRLRVFAQLTLGRELCACEVAELLGVSAPTVSRHMALLERSGLVQSEKRGRWVHYRLSPGLPPSLLSWIDGSLADSADFVADARRLSTPFSCSPPEAERPASSPPLESCHDPR